MRQKVLVKAGHPPGRKVVAQGCRRGVRGRRACLDLGQGREGLLQDSAHIGWVLPGSRLQLCLPYSWLVPIASYTPVSPSAASPKSPHPITPSFLPSSGERDSPSRAFHRPPGAHV